MSALRRPLALSLLALWLGACGGTTPPPKHAARPDDDDGPQRSGPSLDVSSEIGALDEGKVTKAFTEAIKDMQRCLNDGAKRVEFIGGGVGFFVKVDARGNVAHAHMEQSTLGDRETEKCMLDAVAKQEWPAPVGGQSGLARKSFDFDPPNDVRPPTDWSPDQASSGLAAKAAEIRKCKQGSSASFSATLYVDTSGRVLSAGMAVSDDSGEPAIDCLVDVLKSAKFSSPGSWPAKVSVEL